MNNNDDKNNFIAIDDQSYCAEQWMLGDLADAAMLSDKDAEHNKTASLLSLREQAEQQLLHALLLGMAVPGHASTLEDDCDRLVKRTMQGLSPAPVVMAIRGTDLWRTKLSAAVGAMVALVILSVSIFVVVIPENSAVAAIDQVVRHIDEMGDRLYAVHVENVKRGKNAANSRKPVDIDSGRGAHTKRPRFESAKLYLRGNNQFVLIEQREFGDGFIKGSNGVKSWQINRDGRGLVSGDNTTTKLPLSSKSGSLAFLNIVESLNSLKDGYEIRLQREQLLSGHDGLWTKLVAEKIDRHVKGVKRVVLYFNPDNYYIQRLIFDRVHLPGDRQRVKITLDLASQAPLDDDFFEPSAHQ